jgi:hypothetical protein
MEKRSFLNPAFFLASVNNGTLFAFIYLSSLISFLLPKFSCHPVNPARKPQHSYLSAYRYTGNGGNNCKSRSISSLFLPVGPLPTGRQAVPTEGGAGREGGIKALPFLTGFTSE